MEKRTLYAAVLVVLLALGAYAALRAPGKGERGGPAPRPFPLVKAADLTHLEVTTQKDEKTTLDKKDGVWRVTAPGDWPADAQAVKQLTDALEKVSFGDVVTENTGKHQELGVGDKGARLKLTAGGKPVELQLGTTVSGFTMLRVDGKNEVWQAANLAPYLVNKAPKDWREHVIVQLPYNDVDKLTIEVPGGSKLVVARELAPAAEGKPPAPGPWKRVEGTGDAPTESEPLDGSQPSTCLQALTGLRAADFAVDKSPKDAGLDPPALVLTATAKDKTQTIEIGALAGEDYFVRKGGDPTIFMVKKYMVERAAAKPIDYRDKTLLAYKADAIARVRVAQGKDMLVLEHKADKWTMTSAGAFDEGKAKTLTAGLESFVGASFVTDKAAKTELDKPRATVTVEPKEGAKAIVKIGALTKDSTEYYVQREGQKDVLTAKKFAVDRLLKKPTDMAPSPKGPPGGPPGGMPPGMMPPGFPH